MALKISKVFDAMRGTIPMFLYSTDAFSLLASVTYGKNGKKVITSVKEFGGILTSISFDRENANLEECICSVSPIGRFANHLKIDARVKKQGIGVFPALLKERFGIELATNKVAVLDASNGLSVNEKDIADNVCVIGASKSELAEHQAHLVKSNFFPQKIFLSTTIALSGVTDYLKKSSIEKPVMFFEASVNKSHVLIIRNGCIEASYPIVYGMKNIVSLARKEFNLPDDLSAEKFIIEEPSKDQSIASLLTSRIVSELKSYIGFFEVQSGKQISGMYFNGLTPNFSWIERSILEGLGVEGIKIDAASVFDDKKVELGDKLVAEPHWLGLLKLISNHVG